MSDITPSEDAAGRLEGSSSPFASHAAHLSAPRFSILGLLGIMACFGAIFAVLRAIGLSVDETAAAFAVGIGCALLGMGLVGLHGLWRRITAPAPPEPWDVALPAGANPSLASTNSPFAAAGPLPLAAQPEGNEAHRQTDAGAHGVTGDAGELSKPPAQPNQEDDGRYEKKADLDPSDEGGKE